MFSDALTIIRDAGPKGIAPSNIAKKAKLKLDLLEAKLKELRAQGLIAGPYKYGNGQVYYADGNQPSATTVALHIEALVRNSRSKLMTLPQVEDKVRQPFKKLFLDGIRYLESNGKAIRIKGGASTYLLHADVVHQLFPTLASPQNKGEVDSMPSLSRDRVLEAYQHLKDEQGGLSAVSIGKLLSRLGYPKSVLHEFLLNEAHLRRADLHPSTSLELTSEDRDGAMAVPGKSEPAITVTFTE
jgi:hypothetical protein